MPPCALSAARMGGRNETREDRLVRRMSGNALHHRAHPFHPRHVPVSFFGKEALHVHT